MNNYNCLDYLKSILSDQTIADLGDHDSNKLRLIFKLGNIERRISFRKQNNNWIHINSHVEPIPDPNFKITKITISP